MNTDSRDTCLENTFITIETIQRGADIWLNCGLISIKISGCHVTNELLAVRCDGGEVTRNT